MGHDLILVAGVIVLGIFCQWLAWRMSVPAIIPLLGAGFLVGPVLHLLQPQELLGDLFFPFVSLSVAIILFEGALTLEFSEVRHVARIVRNLITIGAVITWLGGALAAYLFLEMDGQLALLFGGLIVVTGPTVINPLLRNVRPTQKIASVLKWEGILIDPLGALLAVLIFDFIAAEGPSHILGAEALGTFLKIVGAGTFTGLLGGFFVAFLLRGYLVPDYLRDVVVLGVVLAVFAASDWMATESGLLAITAMGILLANLQLPQLHHVWHFKEKLSVVLIATLFIILAATVTLADLSLLELGSLAVLAAVLFIIRPLNVLVSAFGSSLNVRERLFLSWIAPRGIVAAAVSSLFAFRLEELGYANASLLATLTFLIIVGTVLVQGSTAKVVARWLGVAEKDPQGFLFLGAHPFARRLADLLQEEGFSIQMVDSNWEKVYAAEREGLPVFHGDVLSEAVEGDLNLSGIGRLFALTSNVEANALACLHYQTLFGSSNVFQLPPRGLQSGSGHVPTPDRLGRLLFHAQATYDNLDELVDEGAVVCRVKLTEKYTYDDFRREYEGNFVPLLCYVNHDVRVITVDSSFTPRPPVTLVVLMATEEKRDNPLIRSSADRPDKDSLLKVARLMVRKEPRRLD